MESEGVRLARLIESLEPGRGDPPAVAEAPEPRPGAAAVACRIDAPCERFGLSEPPCPLDLKLLRAGTGWMLYAQTPPARPKEVAAWLEDYRPNEVWIGPGLAPKGLRAEFDRIPDAWRTIHEAVRVRYMQARPEGSASLFVHDHPDRVGRFVEAECKGRDGVRLRPVYADLDDLPLTPRQRDALALAVALGYYDVPRCINLRDLAGRMGMSIGAASELLRRGERLIVSGYFDRWTAARWKDGN